jgi:UDP-N-acetylmuramoyl-L-alanyl-D-glutamate--2,6-diaminopimelate ligase
MAANFYGHPSRHLQVIGVTGTNGKTSTSMLLQSLLEAGGLRCGLLGTVSNDTGTGRVPARHTTPEALDLQQLLAEMRGNGCRAASIEVSSHALAQGRTEGLDFAGAVFTNLGRDHLDYHQTMEAYEESKALLFRGLRAGAFAAVNVDDPCGVRMAARCAPGVRILRYGLEKGDVRVADLKVGIQGSSFRLVTPEGEFPATLPWLGRFNVANALGAATAAILAGVPAEIVAAALGRAPAVPGRMEAVPGSGEVTVLVDYAHTADAVEAALATQDGRGRRPPRRPRHSHFGQSAERRPRRHSPRDGGRTTPRRGRPEDRKPGRGHSRSRAFRRFRGCCSRGR